MLLRPPPIPSFRWLNEYLHPAQRRHPHLPFLPPTATCITALPSLMAAVCSRPPAWEGGGFGWRRGRERGAHRGRELWAAASWDPGITLAVDCITDNRMHLSQQAIGYHLQQSKSIPALTTNMTWLQALSSSPSLALMRMSTSSKLPTCVHKEKRACLCAYIVVCVKANKLALVQLSTSKAADLQGEETARRREKSNVRVRRESVSSRSRP